MKIANYLNPARTVQGAPASSKKKVLQEAANLIAADSSRIDAKELFRSLMERERLGSTGLGKGVAIPHGRIADLASPVITIARLRHPVDYDAPDNLPVWLAVALLVPEKANDTHLKILSLLAGCFQRDDFISAIKGCSDATSVMDVFDQFG